MEPILKKDCLKENTPVKDRGVSFSWFIGWARYHYENNPDWTTRTLVKEIIVKETMKEKGPYVIKLLSEQRGDPEVFISHAWDMLLGDLISALENWHAFYYKESCNCCCNAQNPILWIDIMAIPQEKGYHTEEDLLELDKTIMSMGHLALCMDASYSPLKRLWCIFELANAITSEETVVTVGVCPTIKFLKPGGITEKIHVEKAKTRYTADKTKIHNLIIDKFGSFEEMDKKLRELLAPRLEVPPILDILLQLGEAKCQ